MTHPYKDGYNVLPKLLKTSGPYFEVTSEREEYLLLKRAAVATRPSFFEHEMTDELYQIACDFIVEHYPVKLDLPYTFTNVVMQIQEDFIIHRVTDDRDWLAMGHICFPSGWYPEEKIGKNFEEIHKPIPGMKTSRKLVESMVLHGPFERYVWTVTFEKRIDCHPSLGKKRFDPLNPEIWVKVEKQFIYGLPEHGAALFILNQRYIPEHEIDRPALASSLAGMDTQQRLYKGLAQDIEPVLEYLHGRSTSKQQSEGVSSA